MLRESLWFGCFLLFAAPARATVATDPASPAPAPVPAPAPASVTTDTPPASATTPAARPASTGFQMAFRGGVAFPMADATGESGDNLGSRYAWQIPIAVDMGAKVTERVFIGGYFGIGFGSTGSDPRVDAACDDDDEDLENDISCSALTLRAGLEGHYAFQPGERMNPWVGYGFGYESAMATISDTERAYSETVTMSGFTYGELMGGLDLRTKAIGAGPFASLAVGQFTHSSTEIGERRSFGGEVDDRALHVWLTLGMRIVVNP